MRITLKQITAVVRDYLDSQGKQQLSIHKTLIKAIKEDIGVGLHEYFYEEGIATDINDYITTQYERYLQYCEHDLTDVTEEGLEVCRYCGETISEGVN